MPQLPALQPARGNGLPMLAKPADAGTFVGALTYAAAPPDASWIDADGRQLQVLQYSELARVMANYEAVPTRDMVSVAGERPTASSGNSIMSISDNGKWAIAVDTTDSSAASAFVYSVSETSMSRAFSQNNPTSYVFKSLAVSDLGDFAFVNVTAGLSIRRREANGSYSAMTHTAYSGIGAIEYSADGRYLISCVTAAPWVEIFRLDTGTTSVAKVAAPFAGSSGASTTLADNVQKDIGRNRDGTRYVFKHGGAPRVYDYKEGVLTYYGFLNGGPSVNAQSVSMSPDGKWICVYTNGLTFELYYEAFPGDGYKHFASYTSPPNPANHTTYSRVAFSPDGQYIVAGGYDPRSVALWKFDDGVCTLVDNGTAWASFYPGVTGMMFGFRYARNSNVLVCGDSSAPYIRVLRSPGFVSSFPIPRIPSYGPVGQRVRAYLKVKP